MSDDFSLTNRRGSGMIKKRVSDRRQTDMGDIMRSFYFLRHGEPDFPEGKPMCLGTEELGLSVMGVQQSHETAALFFGMEVSVFSSPRRQAVETARQFGKIVAILDGLRERDMGIFDGKTYAQIQSRYPDLYALSRRKWMLVPPGGEKLEDAKARFSEAVELIQKSCWGDAVIVTHGDVMELFLGVPAPEYGGFLQVEVDERAEKAERCRVVRRIETRADKDSLWWFRK